jgi:hypothetical protein
MHSTDDAAEVRVVAVKAVIQARSSDGEPWVDQGEISGVGLQVTAFERAATNYLKAYRRSYPDVPQSRSVERVITWSDRVLEV